jgi:hypothetical protein
VIKTNEGNGVSEDDLTKGEVAMIAKLHPSLIKKENGCLGNSDTEGKLKRREQSHVKLFQEKRNLFRSLLFILAPVHLLASPSPSGSLPLRHCRPWVPSRFYSVIISKNLVLKNSSLWKKSI